MNRVAKVFFHEQFAGLLAETSEGYTFEYNEQYLHSENAYALSKTLKTQKEAYLSKMLFSFFDGLIPEGWLLDIAVENWKIQERDRFGLLLACCKNTIGAVSVVPFENGESN